MRVLVHIVDVYADASTIQHILGKLHSMKGITTILEAWNNPADLPAADWAKENKVPTERYSADWKSLPQAANLVKFTKMLTAGNPDLVLAFVGGNEPDVDTKYLIGTALRLGKEVMTL